MFVLPTAKTLFFIATHLGFAHTSVIYATSQSESYVWTETKTGWVVEGKGFPASDFTRDPTRYAAFDGAPTLESVPRHVMDISQFSWKHNGTCVFNNGDRIEKHGNHAFYILNAGGPNEKVFTILFPE